MAKSKAKPPEDKDDSAMNALEQSLTKARVSDARAIEWLVEFITVFKQRYPNDSFSVRHIMDWASSYALIKKTSIPELLGNGYSLGRYLMTNQTDLNIIHEGSYGNRAVYRALAQETPHG